jgi:outer membrane lipoprotein-sorting protein
MKILALILPLAMIGSLSAVSATDSVGDLRAAGASFDCSFFRAPQKSADPVTLEAVLKKMDEVAANFHSIQATFEWDTYLKVINEVDEVETGTVYYRRNGKSVEMMADADKSGSSVASLKPERKYVLLSNGVIRMYQPKPDQLTVYDLGKNRSDFESYIVLGFGGSGQDLQKEFDVTYLGPETVNGVATAKLQLIPKSAKVRNTYSRMLLWIDVSRGISVQQQFFEPEGDYRLAKYSDIQINQKIPDKVFKLNTTSKTQTISPRG